MVPFFPLTIAVYGPGLSVATMADSRSSDGGTPVSMISCSCVLRQSSFEAMREPVAVAQFENRILDRVWDEFHLVHGPIARTTTLSGGAGDNEATDHDVVAAKTVPRVESWASLAVLEASRLAVPRSYTSTTATPVVFSLPCRMAV